MESDILSCKVSDLDWLNHLTKVYRTDKLCKN